MSFQSKMISTVLVSALTLGLVQTADAQEAEFVDQPLTATAMKGDTKIADIPVLEYTPKETKSPIKVTGTQEWDKSLSLSPENGDVTVNLDLSGKVPAGTKVALMDGTTELATTTVDAAGKVTLTAKDLPKDVKKLSLIAKGEGVTGLQSVKCVADKGIDIPASEKATKDAVLKFEKEYVEAAQKNAKSAGGESGETQKQGEESKKVEGEAGEPYVTTTVVTKPGEKKTIKEDGEVKTSVKTEVQDQVKPVPGKEKVMEVKPDPGRNVGKDGNLDPGKFFGIFAGVLAGGAIVGAMMPVIQDQINRIGAQLSGQFTNQNSKFNFANVFNAFDLGKLQAQVKGEYDKRVKQKGGKDGSFDTPGLIGFGNRDNPKDPAEQLRKTIADIQTNIEKSREKFDNMVKTKIAELKKQGVQFSAQLEAFFNDVSPTDLVIAAVVILALTGIVLLIYFMLKDRPDDGKTTNPGGKTTVTGKPGKTTERVTTTNKVITTLPGGEKVVEGDPVVETITTTITPKKEKPEDTTPSTDGNPGNPGGLPTPPEFIEKTLPSRDLATENIDGGVGFSVEVGSVIDCTASVDGSETPDPAPKPKEPSTDETITQRETKKNRKAESCAVLEKDEAAGKIKGGISSIKPGDALWNAALDADGNGVMCDEGDDPAPRPKTPKANAPEPKSPEAPVVQQQRKPVTIAPAGQAPAPVAPVQQQAAVPMQAAPAYGVKYGPKVDTGAEVEGSFINTIVTFVTGR